MPPTSTTTEYDAAKAADRITYDGKYLTPRSEHWNPLGAGGFNPWDAELLIKAAAKGLTISQACELCGISRTQLHRWRHENESFSIKFHEAREHARAAALEQLLAVGKANKARGDWRAIVDWLKLSFNADYRESAQVSVTTNDNRQIVVTDEKRKELQAKYAKFLENKPKCENPS